MSNPRWILFLLPVLAILGCGTVATSQEPSASPSPSPGAPGDKAVPPIPVRTQVMAPEDLEIHTTTTTLVRALRQVQIKSKREGTIDHLAAEEGDTVKADQLLMGLDRRRLDLELERARLEWHRSTDNLRRQQQMLGEKITSQREYEQAVFEEKQAKNNLSLAELSLAESTIAAPFAGVVAARHVEKGQAIAAGTPVMDIVQVDELEGQLHLPLHEASLIQVGTHVTLSSSKLKLADLDSVVDRLAPVVDDKTGTVKVVLKVKNVGRIRPGTLLEARLVKEILKQVLCVPKESVVFRGSEPIVYRVEAGQPKAVAVKLGVETETEFQIVNGLAAKDEVITEGASSLRPDSRIEIVGGDRATTP